MRGSSVGIVAGERPAHEEVQLCGRARAVEGLGFNISIILNAKR
jgi:hypothetical protein